MILRMECDNGKCDFNEEGYCMELKVEIKRLNYCVKRCKSGEKVVIIDSDKFINKFIEV